MFAKYFLRTSILLLLLAGWLPQQAFAAGATHFLVTAPATANAGTAFNVTVTAQDAANTTDTTYAGTVHITSTDGSATLPPNTTLTNGVGTVSVTLKTAGTRTVTAMDTVTASITGTSGNVTVRPSATTHFAVVAPAAAASGAPISVTVTALDQFNNTATAYAGTVHITSTDGTAALPANAALTNGVGTFTVTLNALGTQTVTATDTVTASITGTSGNVNVGPGVATHFTVAAPATATAGTSISVAVTARDTNNNVATGYGGTVHITSTDGSAALPANAGLTNGVGTFAVTFRTAASQTVTATDTVASSITGTSGAVAVAAGPATHFAVVAPATATAGTSISVAVTALDQFNNTATAYAGTVHITSTDGAAVLPADATLTNGSGTFPITFRTAATQTVTATDTVTATITGTSGNINVGPGVATHFTVVAPATATAGTPISATVTARDTNNNVATGYAGTVHITSSDSTAALPADTTLTNGTGTISVTLKKAGAQTVTATDTVTASITGVSGSIAVAAAGLDHLTITAPSPDIAGTPFTATVTAQDQYGNPVITSDTFQVNSDDSQVPNPAVTGAFAAASTATVSITLKTVGSHVLTPSDTMSTLLGSPLTATVAISPGPATHFTLVAPGSTNAGVPFTLAITARDAYGNVATGYAGTFALTSDDPAVPNLASSQTLTNGVGTFTAILYTGGTRTITATDGVTASITGTSNPITVSAQGANHFSVTAPAGATAGARFSVTVTALDQFGNTVTGYGGTVTFTSTDRAATLPANTLLTNGVKTVPVTLATAGTQTITAKDTTTTSIQGTSGTVVVNNVAPTIAVNGVSPATVTAGGAAFTITVTNADGSYISGSVVQWNGLPLPTTFVDATTLKATVSVGLIATAGSAAVTVANPAPGGGVSAPVTVVINNPTPTLTDLSPNTIVRGSPAFSLKLTGTNFVSGSVAYWGGSPRPTTFVSSTQLNAAIAASDVAASGTIQVTVHTSDPNISTGHDSGALPFMISPFPVPIVSSLSPTSATRGDTVTLTINGANFRPNATVTIGTLPLGPVVFVSSSQLSVTFTLDLKAAPGPFPVVVTNDDAAPSNASAIFTVNAQTVSINSLTPSSVVVTTDPTVTQIVTITGSGFRSGDTVAFGSVAIDPKQVVVNTQSQITATLTGADVIGKVGTYNVVVTSPDASFSASAISFTVSPQVVTISLISPESATVGDPTFPLTITGTGFKSGAKVSFGGTRVDPKTVDPNLVNVVSATQITAKIRGSDFVASETNLFATAGPYFVQVTNPDGSQSNQKTFTVNPQTNAVNNLVPSMVNVGDPTFLLTINGSCFKTGATVSFGGTTVDPNLVNVVSATQITAKIRGSDFVALETNLFANVGAYIVQVKNPDGSPSTPSPTFIVTPLAPMSGFQPGLQMISVPYDYSPYDYPKSSAVSASIFKNFRAVDTAGNLTSLLLPLKLAVWDPATAVYDMTNYTSDTAPTTREGFTGLADTLLVGQGYWVKIPSGLTVGLIHRGFLAANPATVRPSTDANGNLILVPLLTGQQVPVPLAPGWNMVGDPFPGPVLIGTLKVQFGNQAYGYTDAVSLGLISGTLYSYDSAGNKYVAQDATKTLDPYVGYWILALQPCTLLVP